MKSHSLCLSHRFYKVCYAFYQTYCIPCSGLAREYNSDLGVDHWTTFKIILRGLRKYFSVMEVIKEFAVKSYVDASFYIDLDDSKSRSGYILKVGAISQSSSVQSIVDIEICEIHTDLNVADPQTKLLSQANHDHSLGINHIAI